MKAAIYNPYLDTLGGGERYSLSFAKVLSDNGYQVDIEWSDPLIIGKLENKFGLDLKNISTVKDVKRGDGYDIIFWVSDGSIPLLHSRHNFLHFQIPFKNVSGKSLLNKMKFFRIEKIICNSEFTKTIIDKEYGVNSIVLYPPVDTAKFKPQKKEKIILSVSRFSQLTQSKRQDVLIEAFMKFYKKGYKDWKLVLAGGTEVGAQEFLINIKEMSKGFPIEIIENPDFKELAKLYGISKLFWSAAGYGVDEYREPSKVEHFGIAVVEAMASGSLPLVFEAGGHKETVADGNNGYLWSEKNQLISKTVQVIKDLGLFKKMAVNAIETSHKYSYENFKKRIESFI